MHAEIGVLEEYLTTWYNVYDTVLSEKNNYYCSKKTRHYIRTTKEEKLLEDTKELQCCGYLSKESLSFRDTFTDNIT